MKTCGFHRSKEEMKLHRLYFFEEVFQDPPVKFTENKILSHVKILSLKSVAFVLESLK
jgi:hypothetical protein